MLLGIALVFGICTGKVTWPICSPNLFLVHGGKFVSSFLFGFSFIENRNVMLSKSEKVGTHCCSEMNFV